MSGIKRKLSWPFDLKTYKNKYLKQKLDYWCQSVTDASKPIRLTRNDYTALLATLPKDFIQIGEPIYDGRVIKRMGEQ